MGSLFYGLAPAIEIEDRALRHLQAVIIAKLRRNEAFSFNWDDEPEVGGDKSEARRAQYGSVWISKSTMLYFTYDSPRTDALNPAWLDALTRAAGTPTGLRVLPEPTK
ncbi:hypothetical protein HQQ80_07940 [Microbacteriaceae bacterium VKM Ac-2855]|nr:hypothetical protein [Microbacteriaceae bacterium VKM Ac-2855]